MFDHRAVPAEHTAKRGTQFLHCRGLTDDFSNAASGRARLIVRAEIAEVWAAARARKIAICSSCPKRPAWSVVIVNTWHAQ
jgi:hypothetical protein